MLASLSSHPSKDPFLPRALESHLESKAGGNIVITLCQYPVCLEDPQICRAKWTNSATEPKLRSLSDSDRRYKILVGGARGWWWLRMIRFIRFPFPLTQTQPSLPQASRQNPSLPQLRPESPTRTNKGFIRPPPLSFGFEPGVEQLSRLSRL